MDSEILKNLMKDVSKMPMKKGEPQMMSVEVESIDAKPMKEEMQGDPWPIVKEKLAAVKSQMQELEELISESYYPGEKEEKGNPGPMEY